MILQWHDAAARAVFAAAGLDTLEALVACREGELVTTARTRTCRRLRLGGDTFYVKAQRLRAFALPARKWPTYFVHGSPLRREADCLLRLHALAVATPPLVCHGGARQWCGLPRAAVLVTRELPGFVGLDALAAHDRARASTACAAWHELVVRVHALGWTLGGLRPRDVLVGPDGSLALIDVRGLRRATKARRARDLRALAAWNGS